MRAAWSAKSGRARMARKRIYIAYTGGTIGMKKTSSGYAPAAGFLEHCLKGMPEFYRPEMPEFTLSEYSPLMDSSDMTPGDWQRIADDIASRYADYDGFVILHGTDTMAYTASALSFMFQNLGKPVIVTGSQIPLAALRSDGQTNLLNALYLAAHYPIHEVSLFFNNQLFRGNRATKADADGFDAFASPNFPPLLKAGIGIDLVAGDLAHEPSGDFMVNPVVPQEVGVITLYPGMAVEVLAALLRQPVKAVILQSYGVGNAPQTGPLVDALEQAVKQGIIVLNCTQCFKGTVNMAGYATGHRLAQAGVISGHDMTVEAALTKLHIILSSTNEPTTRQQLLAANLRGELTTATRS